MATCDRPAGPTPRPLLFSDDGEEKKKSYRWSSSDWQSKLGTVIDRFAGSIVAQANLPLIVSVLRWGIFFFFEFHDVKLYGGKMVVFFLPFWPWGVLELFLQRSILAGGSVETEPWWTREKKKIGRTKMFRRVL